MANLYYSVRLASLIRISDKAYKAVFHNGRTAIIPASQIAGPDYDVYKSEAYWISAWILERKELQYSKKKSAYFDLEGHRVASYKVEKHIPEAMAPVDNEIDELRR